MPRKGYRAPRQVVFCTVCGATRELLLCEIRQGEGRYCSHGCRYADQRYRHDWTAEARRFWAKVDTSGGPDACWPWQGATSRGGYGIATWRNAHAPAARVAYEIIHGYPPRFDACHDCDNPPCCNPRHIYDGTAFQNSQDCIDRGRHNKGSRNGSAVLSETDVVLIRRLYGRGDRGISQEALARRFGVSQRTISRIVRGDFWRHVGH